MAAGTGLPSVMQLPGVRGGRGRKGPGSIRQCEKRIAQEVGVGAAQPGRARATAAPVAGSHPPAWPTFRGSGQPVAATRQLHQVTASSTPVSQPSASSRYTRSSVERRLPGRAGRRTDSRRSRRRPNRSNGPQNAARPPRWRGPCACVVEVVRDAVEGDPGPGREPGQFLDLAGHADADGVAEADLVQAQLDETGRDLDGSRGSTRPVYGQPNAVKT